ncbi:helix-turn-helix transcriptional regulator [Variovorax paradoxus]|uniref:helix-turn-helix transcriptional regulator n=1 Tax=Variovorax paradoxus TaxID=34073 RepID=UPI003D64C0B7
MLERQLLLQLGERLKRVRREQGISSTALAEQVGMSRTTLTAIESGDPSPSMGNYLRVMSALGVSSGLALLVSDTLQVTGAPGRPRSRAAPAVSVMVKADGSHGAQDLQSLMLHQEAVKLMRSDPKLVDQALATLDQWRSSGSSHSQFLWDEWSVILHRRDWRRALSTSRRGRELRQASPLPSILPASKRSAVLEQVSALKKGVLLGPKPRGAAAPEAAR